MLRLWGHGYCPDVLTYYTYSIHILALPRLAAEGQSLSILATANYTHLLLIIKLIRQADLGMPPAEAGAERGQAFAARGGLSAPLGPGGTYDL